MQTEESFKPFYNLSNCVNHLKCLLVNENLIKCEQNFS